MKHKSQEFQIFLNCLKLLQGIEIAANHEAKKTAWSAAHISTGLPYWLQSIPRWQTTFFNERCQKLKYRDFRHSTYISGLVDFRIGQLDLLKGDNLFTQLIPWEGRVGMRVELAAVHRIPFPCHQPRGAVIRIPVTLVVHRHNVQQHHVARLHVQTGKRNPQRRKHSSAARKTKLLNYRCSRTDVYVRIFTYLLKTLKRNAPMAKGMPENLVQTLLITCWGNREICAGESARVKGAEREACKLTDDYYTVKYESNFRLHIFEGWREREKERKVLITSCLDTVFSRYLYACFVWVLF